MDGSVFGYDTPAKLRKLVLTGSTVNPDAKLANVIINNLADFFFIFPKQMFAMFRKAMSTASIKNTAQEKCADFWCK
jgi:hypothetical protein